MAISGITATQTAAPVLKISLLSAKAEYVDFPLEITSHITKFTYAESVEPGTMDSFEITLSNRNLMFLDTEWLQEGNTVKMQWGYAPTNLCPEKIGVITGIDALFPQGDEPQVIIYGSCYAHQMAMRLRHTMWGMSSAVMRKWGSGKAGDELTAEYIQSVISASRATNSIGLTPSEIAITLAYEYGLKPIVNQSNNRQVWPQCGISDWDFLTHLAKIASCECGVKGLAFAFWVDRDELHFELVGPNEDKAIMRLTWFCDDMGMLKEFRIRHDTQANRGAGTEVTVAGHDPRRMTWRGYVALNPTVMERLSLGKYTTLEPGVAGAITNQAKEEFLQNINPKTHTAADEASDNPLESSIATGASVITPETAAMDRKGEGTNPAETVASGRFRDAEQDQIEADAVVVGWPTLMGIRAMRFVDIRGIGSKYSGLYQVMEVRHEIGGNGYECLMKLRRNAKGANILNDPKNEAEVDGKVKDSPDEAVPIQEPFLVDIDPATIGGGGGW